VFGNLLKKASILARESEKKFGKNTATLELDLKKKWELAR
jgi:hypothetical protein